MGVGSIFKMPRVMVFVPAMPSVQAMPAFTLPSAVALAEFAVRAEDAVLAPGSACSSVSLESGSAVPSVAVAVLYLRRMRRIHCSSHPHPLETTAIRTRGHARCKPLCNCNAPSASSPVSATALG